MAIRAERQRGKEADDVLRYWRSVADLPFDRQSALRGLEASFARGSLPQGLDGPYRGRLLATTFGYGLDPVMAGLTRAWMPWKGKTLNHAESTGRNIFMNGSKRLMRIVWPGYHDVAPESEGRYTTFQFVTHTGPSKLMPEVEVFRIDYDTPDDPAFIIRRILDELVQIGDGLYLGQAL